MNNIAKGTYDQYFYRSSFKTAEKLREVFFLTKVGAQVVDKH